MTRIPILKRVPVSRFPAAQPAASGEQGGLRVSRLFLLSSLLLALGAAAMYSSHRLTVFGLPPTLISILIIGGALALMAGLLTTIVIVAALVGVWPESQPRDYALKHLEMNYGEKTLAHLTPDQVDAIVGDFGWEGRTLSLRRLGTEKNAAIIEQADKLILEAVKSVDQEVREIRRQRGFEASYRLPRRVRVWAIIKVIKEGDSGLGAWIKEKLQIAASLKTPPPPLQQPLPAAYRARVNPVDALAGTEQLKTIPPETLPSPQEPLGAKSVPVKEVIPQLIPPVVPIDVVSQKPEPASESVRVEPSDHGKSPAVESPQVDPLDSFADHVVTLALSHYDVKGFLITILRRLGIFEGKTQREKELEQVIRFFGLQIRLMQMQINTLIDLANDVKLKDLCTRGRREKFRSQRDVLRSSIVEQIRDMKESQPSIGERLHEMLRRRQVPEHNLNYTEHKVPVTPTATLTTEENNRPSGAEAAAPPPADL